MIYVQCVSRGSRPFGEFEGASARTTEWGFPIPVRVSLRASSLATCAKGIILLPRSVWVAEFARLCVDVLKAL